MLSKILFLTLLSTTTWAQVPQAVKDEIDQRIKHQHNPSIALAVYESGNSDFYVKGLQNKQLGITATHKTVYEIGSISKTFTSLLLAQMVVDGKLKLDDPVENIWPQPFALKDQDSQAITLKHLATHTSGLPRLPANLSLFSKDPYADYDRSKLLAAIQQLDGQKAGVNYLYSNFAVGLLGETMAQHENSSFNQLVSDKILKPLALKQTHMVIKTVPEQFLAQGYSNNTTATAWQFQALGGAGSIRSSIEDLLAYGVAHLNHTDHGLETAMQLATTNHYQQGRLKVGLGWHINANGVLWHNGGTAGFSSIIMIDPVQQKVVAGITNSSPQTNIEDIVLHVMNPGKPMTDHEFPVAIDDDRLKLFTGTFKLSDGDKEVGIIADQGQLFFNAPKQPRQALYYIGKDTFRLKLFNAKLTFKINTTGDVTSFDFAGWGKPQNYIKVQSHEAQSP